MSLYQRQYVGKYAVVEYGDRLLNADTYKVVISGDIIDITNISVFEPQQVRLPKRRDDPKGILPPTPQADIPQYYANHGVPMQQIFGGRRKYSVSVTGRTYKISDSANGNYIPNFGDFVRIIFTDNAPGIGTHPKLTVYCIVTEVEFGNDVRGYQNWSLTAEGTAGTGEDSSIVPEGL